MYKNEELIYSNTVDVSKESGIPNNKVYTRVIKRIEVKSKNLFRWTEKIIVYLDVECESADLLGSYQSYGVLSEIVPSVEADIRRHNRKIAQEHNKVHRVEDEEIWKANNFALSYKIDEPYTHKEIRIFKNGVKI
jgi:hypothetical protein